MNLTNRVFNLINVHLGEGVASDYNVFMSKLHGVIPDIDIIKHSEVWFKSKLPVDNIELHRYMELDYTNVDTEAWINKVGFEIVPRIGVGLK